MNTQSKVVFEVDKTLKTEWDSIIRTFSDVTIFQTWEFGAFKCGEDNLSHAVLKLDERTVAAAQVMIRSRVPGLKYAYIAYGPMWRTKGITVDLEILDLVIRELAEEYVRKRGYSLRIFPYIHDGDPLAERMIDSFLRNGFVASSKERQRTLFLDISLSMEDLRKNMRRKWRQCLRYSEEACLNVTLSKSKALFARCLEVYKEMHERKHFRENVRMDDFLAIHELLLEDYKFNIVTIGKDERIDACIIFSAIGDTGFAVLAATATSGLENYASYLAYWEMIKYLKGKGIHWIDFRGIDPKGNWGVYYFKTGISGKRGLEVCLLGEFIIYHGNFARLIIKGAKKVRSRCQVARSILRKFLR